MVPPSRSTAATIQALQVGQPTIVTYRKWVQGRGKHNIQVYHSIQVQGRGKHNGIQTMGRHVWCSTKRMYVVLSPVPQAPYGAPSSLWCPKVHVCGGEHGAGMQSPVVQVGGSHYH